MAPITRHDLAPDIALKAQDGTRHRLDRHRNRNVVLFFTGRADDPDTGRETAAFQEHEALFDQLNADVIGVSADSVRGNRRLAERAGIDFDLLADPRHKLSRQFGVIDEQTGEVQPTAVLIDGDGRIERIYRSGDPESYATRIAGALATLNRDEAWDAVGTAPA